MEEVSQDEIEQLLNGTLPEERRKEVLNSDEDETAGQSDIQDAEAQLEDEQQSEQQQENSTDEAEIVVEDKKALKEAKEAEKKALKKQKKLEKEAAKKAKKEAKESTAVEGENEKKPNAIVEKVNSIPTKILIIFLAIMAVLVVAMGAACGITLYKKNKLESANKVKVTVPTYKANTTNFIFISDKKEFEGSELELIKMLVDPVATVFYFDRAIDFMSYEADLKDNHGRTYSMDISFAESSNADDTESSFVRFEPINTNAKEFKLSISNPVTGEIVDFNIELDSQPKSLSAKYLSEPINTTISDQNMEIVLEDSVFSSSGSIIKYRLHWNDSSSAIQMGWKGISADELINIKEGGIIVPTTKKYPAMYIFPNENTIIGRMDFERVKNLNSNIEVNFNSLFRQRQLNQTVNVSDLPYRADEANQTVIEMGEYKLILENFGQFEDKCILTYYGLDPLNNRIEMKLDSSLSMSDNSGMEVVIDGECISQKEGGNVIYSTKSSEEMLGKVLGQTHTLNLKNVGIKIPTQTVDLNLSKSNGTQIQADKKEIEDFIVEAFKNRLSVKSGEMESSELQNYFELEVLKDSSISADYFQPVSLVEPAQYSSQVLTIAKNDDAYFAAVQDSWKGKDNIKETHFYRTHKIIVKNIDGKLKIVEDVIIK